ncbi:SLC13 family permease [Veillonella magna]|uniref:SLC13 family permease n=1 Tax=Veillonella magna TaxID=464322 RepID=UPI0023F22BE5|nr:SLC13 family permease [Veillonella magna]MBD8976071.1 C4-dicarboxylate ABC transporter [Veillonella magna]
MTSVSLFVLIGSIVVGIWRRMNVGVIAVGMSLVLAEIAGIPTKQVYGGFPTKLFVTLLGTMLFFSLLQKNKTLEVISDFTVQSIGKRLFLLPFVVYMLAFMLSAAGPGAIPVLPIAIIIGVTLAKQLDISPVLMGGCATLGAVGGTLSPLALTGIIVQEILTEQGIAGMEADLFIKGTIINLVGVISLYIFYKGYTLKALVQEKRRITFNKNQKISVVLLMFLVIMVIGFNFDVGLVGFFLAMVLLAVKGSDEKSGISQIPWSVIIMVCGVNVLMTLVQKLGGVKLLANFLANFMSEQSAQLLWH